MKKFMMAAAACTLLAGCATETPPNGEKVAKEESYDHTGTFIKRKNGTGLGGTAISTVRKQDVENARAMSSSGAGGRNGF
ncbi:hypothetical protein [Telluria aromaticivorans]|uniref:Lipoprotein n=1 Tax=Telluria aromaticivorans TaxID=2725995 RepID=A0A7Y2JWM9_9BURK|nr:hypothetical protein [Telluria aromaticivorans]NNG22382.1 hypothetical protein [Telluria aromaticivorans]